MHMILGTNPSLLLDWQNSRNWMQVFLTFWAPTLKWGKYTKSRTHKINSIKRTKKQIPYHSSLYSDLSSISKYTRKQSTSLIKFDNFSKPDSILKLHNSTNRARITTDYFVNLNRPTYSILYFHDTLIQNVIAEFLFLHKDPKMFCIHDKEKPNHA